MLWLSHNPLITTGRGSIGLNLAGAASLSPDFLSLSWSALEKWMDLSVAPVKSPQFTPPGTNGGVGTFPPPHIWRRPFFLLKTSPPDSVLHLRLASSFLLILFPFSFLLTSRTNLSRSWEAFSVCAEERILWSISFFIDTANIRHQHPPLHILLSHYWGSVGVLLPGGRRETNLGVIPRFLSSLFFKPRIWRDCGREREFNSSGRNLSVIELRLGSDWASCEIGFGLLFPPSQVRSFTVRLTGFYD